MIEEFIILKCWADQGIYKLITDQWNEIKSQHPAYQHAVWTQSGLRVTNKCLSPIGGCYGCGRTK